MSTVAIRNCFRYTQLPSGSCSCLVQSLGARDRSRRHNADDFTLYKTFRELRILHLLRDRNLITFLDELVEIAFHRMERDSASDRSSDRSPFRQCQLQLSRNRLHSKSQPVKRIQSGYCFCLDNVSSLVKSVPSFLYSITCPQRPKHSAPGVTCFHPYYLTREPICRIPLPSKETSTIFPIRDASPAKCTTVLLESLPVTKPDSWVSISSTRTFVPFPHGALRPPAMSWTSFNRRSKRFFTTSSGTWFGMAAGVPVRLSR